MNNLISKIKKGFTKSNNQFDKLNQSDTKAIFSGLPDISLLGKNIEIRDFIHLIIFRSNTPIAEGAIKFSELEVKQDGVFQIQAIIKYVEDDNGEHILKDLTNLKLKVEASSKVFSEYNFMGKQFKEDLGDIYYSIEDATIDEDNILTFKNSKVRTTVIGN